MTQDAAGRRWTVALVLLAPLVLALHAPSLGAYLFEDDVEWVLYGRTTGILDAFSRSGGAFYRPLIRLYFLVLAGWLHASPLLLHAANVCLHLVNVGLVFRLARALGLVPPAAFTAALLMAAGTRAVESVAWISGVSSVLLTTFFLLAHLGARLLAADRRLPGHALTFTSVAAALLTHEAGVMLLPTLIVADLFLGRLPGLDRVTRLRGLAVRYAPSAILLAAYLAIAFGADRSSYVVTEGHYRLGWHWVSNLGSYLVSLYVGRPDTLSRVLTLVAFAAALAPRRPVLRVGVAWTLLTLLPFCFFTWGLTARYLYLPSVGFCLALASLLPAGQTDRVGRAVRLATVVIVAAVAYRFAFFGAKIARDAVRRSLAYVEYAERFRREHPRLEPGATVTVASPGPGEPAERYLEPLLRVALDDPALRVVIAGR